jgi:hypothetical protein
VPGDAIGVAGRDPPVAIWLPDTSTGIWRIDCSSRLRRFGNRRVRSNDRSPSVTDVTGLPPTAVSIVSATSCVLAPQSEHFCRSITNSRFDCP